MRQLLLMRHAKSDRANWVGPDHERPLNARGVRSAEAMGRHLTALDLAPERVISSTAVRARTTAELAARAGEWSAPLELDARLYGAGPMEIINIAREFEPEVRRVLLVGHEPTWSMVASGLTGGEYVEMPTAAVAVIEFDQPWHDIAWDSGSLVDHLLARPLIGD